MIQAETAPPHRERREAAAPPSRAWWLVVGALAIGQVATLAAVLGPGEARRHRGGGMPAMRVSEHHDLGAAEREEQERRRLGAVWSLKSVSAATTLTKHGDGA